MSRLRFSARSALAPLLAALVLAGCATSPATIDPSSLPVTPTLFRESEAVAASPAAPFQAQWWKVFSDPVLDRLVDQATRSNSSVQVAAARLAQARAIAGATDANRSVQLGLGAGAV
ncbi:MAG: RND transporter, partial [Rubrivivax sp.]|nr:RND transporter [Rubrivivax sp.]